MGINGPFIDAKDLEQATRDFRKAGGATKNLSAANKEVAKDVEKSTRAEAKGRGTAQQSKAANVLAGKGTVKSAILAIRNTKPRPFGIGAFLGAKQYPQFPEWVGNQHEVGPGAPLIVGDVLVRDGDKIAEVYAEKIMAVLSDKRLTK